MKVWKVTDGFRSLRMTGIEFLCWPLNSHLFLWISGFTTGTITNPLSLSKRYLLKRVGAVQVILSQKNWSCPRDTFSKELEDSSDGMPFTAVCVCHFITKHTDLSSTADTTFPSGKSMRKVLFVAHRIPSISDVFHPYSPVPPSQERIKIDDKSTLPVPTVFPFFSSPKSLCSVFFLCCLCSFFFSLLIFFSTHSFFSAVFFLCSFFFLYFLQPIFETL